MPSSFLQDARHGLRLLRARPGFTLGVVLTLALGIGANTAVFSAIEGLLFRPLPFPHEERLVHVYNTYPKMGVEDAGTTVPDYLDRRGQADALADSAIYGRYSYDLAEHGVPQRLAGVFATPSLFTTLGVPARLGRTFSADEALPGHDDAVLLGDALWRNAFAADASIVGRRIRLSGRSYRVVGVMPPGFVFPSREIQLWVPFVFSERQKSDAMRGFEFAESVGRLKPGATIAQLDAQFDAIVARNLDRIGIAPGAPGADFRSRATSTGFTGRARSLHGWLAADAGSLLWLLQAAAVLVLAIACANVANLMLIRATARQRELGVRAALGATRGRIARQLLIESLALALIGGGAGVLVAVAGMALIRALGLDGTARGFAIGLDAEVLGVAVVASLVTGVVIGLVPALSIGRARTRVVIDSSRRGASSSRAARATRNALVAIQIGLAATLLLGAGLLIRSFWQVQQQDPGFNADHLVSVSVNLSRDRYRDPTATAQFADALVAAVRALPGVRAAGIAGSIPFSPDNDSNPYFVEGGDANAPPASGYLQVADEGFFAAMQIPLLRGRAFRAGDDAAAEPVAIIDQALARNAFGTRDPLGRRIATRSLDGLSWRTIVGVVGTIKRHQLSEAGNIGTYYFAYRQNPSRIFRIAIRTEAAAGSLVKPLRAAAAGLDPEQPLWDIVPMHERISRSLDGRRTPLFLIVLFATLAAGLCALGIYGVLAFGVAQRSGEIGVRMALGANRRDVLRLVIADGGRLLALGLALGAGLSFATLRLLRAQLFGIEPADPPTLAAAFTLVVAIALLASWMSARRATAISPIEALRCE